jgi:hypothetical protein
MGLEVGGGDMIDMETLFSADSLVSALLSKRVSLIDAADHPPPPASGK